MSEAAARADELRADGGPGPLSNLLPNRPENALPEVPLGQKKEASSATRSPTAPARGEPAGEQVLDDVEAFLARFVSFPSEDALVALVLWAAHTHAADAFESSPRLALLSPEPGSGKTRVLELLDTLVARAMHALNASTAAIFRTIEKEAPTLLLDEVDAIFGRRGKDDSNEDLRALLNAGHRRGATIPRCVGPTHEVRQFPVYAPVALAGLGDLPDTLMTRSVVVRMQKRSRSEVIEPFRYRDHEPLGHALRDRLEAWADERRDELRDARPVMPEGVTDRPADVWEPLLAIADAAGGAWPERARAACVALVGASVSREASLGVRLLTDLREVWGEGTKHLATVVILERLCALEEAPWASLRGAQLDARGLAWRLGAYGIVSKNIKLDGGKVVKGYRREDLWEAWERYCPPSDPPEAATGATPATALVTGTGEVAAPPTGSATSRPAATDHEALTRGVAPVAEVAPSQGWGT